jgi:hypothetical protein
MVPLGFWHRFKSLTTSAHLAYFPCQHLVIPEPAGPSALVSGKMPLEYQSLMSLSDCP